MNRRFTTTSTRQVNRVVVEDEEAQAEIDGTAVSRIERGRSGNSGHSGDSRHSRRSSLEEVDSGGSSSSGDESDSRLDEENGEEGRDIMETAHFKLDSDIYNEMLVSYLHTCKKDDDPELSKHARRRHKLSIMGWPIVLSIVCALLQTMMSLLVLQYVRTQAMPLLSTGVNLALHELAHSRKSEITEEVAEKICGRFNGVMVDASDEAAKIPYPEGDPMEGSKYFWTKLPTWRWDTKWLGVDDESTLDTLRFVTSESFFAFEQGYAILFWLTNFLWLCSIFVELRGLIRFVLMIYGFPEDSDFKNAIDRKEHHYILRHLPHRGKVMGVFIVVVRVALASLLGFAGWEFLRYTSKEVDLILNSLALIFIFELDGTFFKTMLSHQQQMSIDNLKPIKYKAVFPTGMSKMMRHIQPCVCFLLLVSGTWYARKLQLEKYITAMENAAMICLFAGPSAASNAMAPVPGVCESLLKLSCATEANLSHASPCVVTSYQVPWALDEDAAQTQAGYLNAAFDYPEGVSADNVFALTLQHDNAVAGKFRLVDGVEERFRDAKVEPPARWMEQAMQRACLGMFHYGEASRTVHWEGKDRLVAPFYCPKDQLWPYFKDFHYVWHRSLLIKTWMDVTPSHMPLYSWDSKLGQALAGCGR